jgi:hypothetical protein
MAVADTTLKEQAGFKTSPRIIVVRVPYVWEKIETLADVMEASSFQATFHFKSIIHCNLLRLFFSSLLRQKVHKPFP